MLTYNVFYQKRDKKTLQSLELGLLKLLSENLSVDNLASNLIKFTGGFRYS